jgi:hypothetical protein
MKFGDMHIIVAFRLCHAGPWRLFPNYVLYLSVLAFGEQSDGIRSQSAYRSRQFVRG